MLKIVGWIIIVAVLIYALRPPLRNRKFCVCNKCGFAGYVRPDRHGNLLHEEITGCRYTAVQA